MEFTKTFDKLAALASLKNMIGGGKSNPVTSLMENPEDYKLEAYIDGDEIVIRLKKRNRSLPGRIPAKPTRKPLPPPKTR